MVVEDDDATREFLADNLTADSYGVVTASTGREAFNLLQMKDCDLLLLDVMLPDASGYELPAPAVGGRPRTADRPRPARIILDRTRVGGRSCAGFLARGG